MLTKFLFQIFILLFFYDVKSGKLEENAELNRFSAKLKTEFPSDNGKRQQKEECKEKDGIKRRRKEGK